MTKAEVLQSLKTKWSDAIVAEQETFGENTLEVNKVSLFAILSYLKQLGYAILVDMTGVDYLSPVKRTKVVYWIQNPETQDRIRISAYVDREEKVPSVVSLWEGADWYERELFDLFGVPVEDHPDLKRLLMPEDWIGHPLRKDYPLTEEPVQFKHDVKPKVPSQIIPYVKERKKP